MQQQAKNTNQYMTFEELAGFLLNYSKTNSMARNQELGTVYGLLLGYNYKIPEIHTSWSYDDKLREIFQKISAAKSDIENPKAKEFLDYATIVIGTRLAKNSSMANIDYIKPKPIDMLRVFMKQIDNIKSNQIKYDSLKYLIIGNGKLDDAGMIHQILVKIAENSLATADDLYNLQKSYVINDPIHKKIFVEIEAKTQKFIEEEMKKILPDVQKVRAAVATLINSAQNTGDMALENEVRKTYNADKILNPESGKEYVAKIEEAKIEKIAKLEAEVAEQNKKLQIADRQLKETQEGWRQTTETLREKQIELQKLQAINEGLNNELGKTKQHRQRLIDATEKLQIGIGSRGINKIREEVKQIEREKHKKER